MSHPGKRHLWSIADLDLENVTSLVDRTLHYAEAATYQPVLAGRVIGTYFGLTSTRTRTAFTAAALRLGGHVIAYGPNDLQLAAGESVADTVTVLSRALDAMVIRVADPVETLRPWYSQDDMAVVNAMTAAEHPSQAIADLATLRRRCGRLDELDVLYVGEGNSTAVALALSLSLFPGTTLHARTPAGYGLPGSVHETVAQRAGPGTVAERHDMADLPPKVDAIYTTQWETTGTTKPDPNWRDRFAEFRVDAGLMRRYPEAWFLHDLPAHRGAEVDAAVIDGPQSMVFDQAANKTYSAMAILVWCHGR